MGRLLAAAIIGGLIQAAPTLIGKILIALGIGIATYSGITVLIDNIKTDVIDSFTGLDPDILQLLGVMQVDTAITMVFSAIAARLVLNGLTSGTIKRFVLK